MSLNKYDIAPLISELAEADDVIEKSVIFDSLERADFQEPGGGYAIWLWGEIEPSDRAKLNYLFRDDDRTLVSITIVVRTDHVVREIELWRGDGKPVQRLPSLNELFVPEIGKIYGP